VSIARGGFCSLLTKAPWSAFRSLLQRFNFLLFGPAEGQWWRQGVPAEIRKTCAQTREDDPDPVDDVFAYTTLIHLAKITVQVWMPGALSIRFPFLPNAAIERNFEYDYCAADTMPQPAFSGTEQRLRTITAQTRLIL